MTEEGFCECGCGRKTNIIKKNNSKLGYIKGKRFRFIRGHNDLEKLMNNSIKTRFKKGCTPWMKGKKGKKSPNFGRKCSEEAKLKISIKKKGHKVSEKTRKLISKKTKEALKNIPNWKERRRESIRKNKNFGSWGKGKKLSLKNLEKLRIANTGRKSSRKGKTFEEFYGLEEAKIIKNKIKIARAKQITPLKDTKIEVKVQNLLKKLGIEFVTHQYMNIKYGYQCDIFIPVQEGIPQKTVIECDGDYWHGNLEIYPIKNMARHIKVQRCLDYERTSQLEEAGFRVIRLWEHDIKNITINKLNRIQEIYESNYN